MRISPACSPCSTLSLSIPNRISDLAAGLATAEAYLATWSINEGDASKVIIILDELGSNILKAAWPDGGEHWFTVELRIEPSYPTFDFVLLVIDDGVPFDPTGAVPPKIELSLDDREPGGLGLLMLQELTDSLEYSRVDGRNRLKITKRLAATQRIV